MEYPEGDCGAFILDVWFLCSVLCVPQELALAKREAESAKDALAADLMRARVEWEALKTSLKQVSQLWIKLVQYLYYAALSACVFTHAILKRIVYPCRRLDLFGSHFGLYFAARPIRCSLKRTGYTHFCLLYLLD